MYERLFCWIVGRINDIIEVKNYDARIHGKNTVIGVLDIYGFEIFEVSRELNHMLETGWLIIPGPIANRFAKKN